jgi:ABC-type glycerol-3-phosphate transport system substrate-binding protein
LAYEEEKKKKDEIETEPETELDTGDTTPVTDETETNEFGMTVIKYPDVLANQVDIIYIAGEDMYIDFIDNGWLHELDTELSSSSKKIKEYVSSTLLSAVKYNGTSYAIPNNRVIGDYTYMLLNKELVQKYSQEGYVQYGQIDGFFNENLYLYLQTIYEIKSQFNPNVVPIDATYEECLELLAHYWAFDTETYDMVNKFSVFGSHYKDMESLSRGSVALGYGSLFEDEDFVKAFLQLNKYKYGTDANLGSYFGDATGKTAAVKFVTGDSTVLTYNEKEGAYEYVETVGGKKVTYYPIVVKYPTASSEDIYGNMFGVCTYSVSLSRSMEIVTYLNTNSDFRNLLQYGVEGTHYEVEEDEDGNKTVKRLTKDYHMDIYATGNVFIAYPEPDMSADIWESGKVQNRYSLVEPLLGLDFAAFSATTGEEEEDISVPKIGYLYDYTSGYSKDVLKQDAALAKWLDDSDAAGKGVYIYATEFVEGQNRTIYYYVYNNDVSKSVSFDVEDIRVVEERTDSKGKVSEVQTDLDFIFTYTYGSTSSKSGYEISLVKLYTKKTNEFEIKVRNGDDSATPVITAKKDGIIDFDFLNTEEYSIEVYEKLRKPAFRKNALLDSWIAACNGKTTYVMEYQQEKNGKVEYTFVVYRTGLTYVTNTHIVPTGDKGEVDIGFNFTYSEDERLDKDTEATYLLHYVRVTVDKGVDVSYSITSNGKTENVLAENKTVPEVDPDFTILGNLDTEMVKYLSKLNDVLVAKLNACQSYSEIVALVAEMQMLLVTTGEASGAENYVLLADVVSEFNVYELAEHLMDAVATSTKPKLDEEGTEMVYRGEPLVYYDSPNTIYHKWLTQFGYQPSTKK